MEREKVSCSDCRFYTQPESGGVDYICKAPQNRMKVRTKMLGVKFMPLRRPEQINLNGDCKWFVQSFFHRVDLRTKKRKT